MNYKRFRRLYRLANLQIGRRRRRGRAKIVRGRPLRHATRPFEGWTLDFMHDRLFGGRAFRTLSMEDEFSRSGLALELSFSFPSQSVIAVLDSVAAIYGYPKYLRIDNGTEFTSKLSSSGPRNTTSSYSSSSPVSQRRTLSSSPSTTEFVLSSSTRSGSTRLPKANSRPMRGCIVTTRRTRTARLAIARPRSSSRPTKLPNLHRNQWLHDGPDATDPVHSRRSVRKSQKSERRRTISASCCRHSIRLSVSSSNEMTFSRQMTFCDATKVE